MSNIKNQLAGLSPEKRDLLAKYLQSKTANVLKYINPIKPDNPSGIEKASEKEFYPVSSAQKRMYLIHQVEEVGTSYNMLGAVTIEGVLDRSRLDKTFRILIHRHEAFRTSFEMADGEPVQRIHPTVEFEVSYWEAGADEVQGIIQDFVKPFDLSKAPLLRVGLIQLSAVKHILLYDMHHIISDGTSMSILMREFAKVYNGDSLPELGIQYKDFSEWQGKLIQSGAIQKQETYWLQTFAGEIPVLELPTDYPRPPVMNFEGGMVNLEIDAATIAKLKQYSSLKSATLFMTLIAAYNILLARLTGQEDIITGVPVAGRGHADLQNIIGMFINTVTLRNYPRFELTFEVFLEAVRQNTLAAFANQDYQFEMLLEKLKLKRDSSRNPLFDTVFNYQNMAVDGDRELSGTVKFSPYEYEATHTKFDITMYVAESGDSVQIHCNYRTSLLKKTTIEYIMNEYLRLLQVITENPRLKIREYPIFLRSNLPATVQRIIPQVTYEPFPEEAVRQSIGKYFETQVKKYHNQVAVKTDKGTWTYGELNARANQIAWALIHQQTVGQTVALLFEHGAEMIAVMLGALKAGSIYVPLDPDYPAERLKFMLEDSQALRIITNNANLASAEALNRLDRGIQIINVDQLDMPESNPAIEVKPEAIAYIIYTSGSTGNPKGVTQTHRNILKFAGEFINLLHLNPGDRLALFTSYSHTVAVIDIFSALFSGATVYPYDVKYSGDMIQMVRWLKAERITIYHSVPTVYRYCMDALAKDECLPDMRMVVIGGEAVHQSDVERYREHFGDGCFFVNLFGASEILIATAYLMNKTTKITKPLVPIGYPVPGVEVYLLNEDNRETGVYGYGEIVYRSDFLSPGYWRLEDKTREVFGSDPIKHNGTVYRSGDWGRLLPDGTFEYTGRKDQQVKIRGFRIELSEIEDALVTLAGIKKCTVIAKQRADGESILAGYYVPLEGWTITADEIREKLKQKLPDYMIPAYLQSFEELPLTPNGKIDRMALSAPDENLMVSANYEAPRNVTEVKLVDIWREVLRVAKVGIHDNFFERGGHSLKAANLAARIHKEFNVEIPLRQVFQLPTIKELANYLTRADHSIFSAIEPTPSREYYPVSSAQKRMYILNQLEEAGNSYNIPGVIEVEGPLEQNRLKEAFQQLIRRHESFRTSFALIDGQPTQRIHPEVDFRIEYLMADEPEVAEVIRRFIRPFDLSKAPLLRVGLIRFKEERHLLVYDMHHIISDGTSMGILMREFARVYNGETLPELRIQYKDFSEWQQKLFYAEAIQKQEAYWLSTFAGEIPVLDLPVDYPRPAVQSFTGDRFGIEIEPALTQQLNVLTAQTGTTMFMLLLAVYTTLLSRYTGQEDIIVGSPIAGRGHADLEKIIGMFVNTLALRNYPEAAKKFRDYLIEVKQNALAAYENQDYQFEELVEKLNLRRDLSRNPLFDTMLALQNMDMSSSEIAGLKFTPYDFKNEISKFDLTIWAVESGPTIQLDIEYCTQLFKKETIERLARHFRNILARTVRNPDLILGEIDPLSEAERKQLLEEFNNTRLAYPQDKTIHGLFEEQVERTPDNIALIFEDQALTYRELNAKADSLASVLLEKGVTTDNIIGIMVKRSLEMIIGLLGILKAGGAYLPIDPEYPAERIKFMLADSRAAILLTQADLAHKIDYSGITGIDITQPWLYERVDSNPPLTAASNNTARHLAYVIYTSGSTGKPKGVMIEHRAVINFMTGIKARIDFDASKTILALTTISFDIFGLETWLPLAQGMKIIIASEIGQRDPKYLGQLIRNHQINMLQTTPSRMQMLINSQYDLTYLQDFQEIMIGGEALPESLRLELQKYTQAKIYNMYGPTETTIWSTVKEITAGTAINIGTPIANTQIYIVNGHNQLQPVGVVGELYIAGDGLARGYLNRPELTAEKFVFHSYDYRLHIDYQLNQPNFDSKLQIVDSNQLNSENLNLQSEILNPESNRRMYKTGDLARWLPDGDIEFLGRIDHQVKIRGYRIELGEIEARLLSHQMIQETVVVVKTDLKEEPYICAYFVSHGQPSTIELRQFLMVKLPEYMVPNQFIQLEKMPLTPNGKIDRLALPEPDENLMVSANYEAPWNETEAKLVDIWREVLRVAKVGIHDNFFERGGHSLKAANMAARIHKEFNMEIPLREIFQSPTIKELAKYLTRADHNIFSAIEPAPSREYYPVSAMQMRIYILNQLEGTGTSYNIPGVVEITGTIERNRLEEAFGQLIRRHESFRTSFALIDGQPTQRIHPEVDFRIEYLMADEPEVAEVIRRFIRPFDLSKAPLLRVGLIRFKEERHLLVYDMHHIISDGTSMGILMREFARVYNGETLPELRIQYKDFSEWQQKLFYAEAIQKQEAYWLSTFAGEIPVLDLPVDYPRPAVQSFTGDRFGIEIEPALTQQLNVLTAQTGTTMFMLLLAVYTTLLSRYTGQEDIIVGSPIAGRGHADLEKIIGMFVNTLALRNYPEAAKKFRDYLIEVKQNALAAYENQDYQFEELVEKLNLRRDLSRNPLFDTMLALQNMDMSSSEIAGLKFTPYDFKNEISKFDLTIWAVESGPTIQLDIEYCTQLFKKETIERLARHFRNILARTVRNPDLILGEIDPLSEAERKQLLEEFNNTRLAYPQDKTIHGLFEEQVERTPDNIALIFEDQALTYRELNAKADSLASVLLEKGVTTDNIIGIMVKRSLEMIIGLLGILKAGGAYLPIDPEYPAERIKFMLADSRAAILLTQADLAHKIDYSGITGIDITQPWLYERVDSNPPLTAASNNTARHLAYVIYTSGSTGKPKGVMIEHRAVINFMTGIKARIDFDASKTILALTTISFDIFGLETWLPLAQGMKIIIASEIGQRDPKYLGQLIRNHQINMLQTTPSRMQMLINSQYDLTYLQDFQEIMIGGEALPESLRLELQKYTQAKIYNMYGPTETTIWSTVKEITAGTAINIGTPIANTQIYIVNRDNQLQPIGVVGELCIAGAGLARGYLNRLELTVAKFVPNPFYSEQCIVNIEQFTVNNEQFNENNLQLLTAECQLNNNSQLNNGLMYKTGDLARWLPDGNIQFLGRIDHQVKIRGYRIELGEIEARLLSHPLIKKTVVLVREDPKGDPYLYAYFVSDAQLSAMELREYLLEDLPEYMVPFHYIQVEKIPLLPNGKTDQKALLAMDLDIQSEIDFVDLGNSIEAMIRQVWREVLGLEKIGVRDNFFGLGGNSLKAIQVIAKMDNYGITLKDMMRYPTIAELSQLAMERNSYTEPEELPLVLKKNLEIEYFFTKEGGLDPIAKNLDCHALMIYYYLKRYIPDYTNYLLIFLQDISFHVVLNSDGNLYNLDVNSFRFIDEIFRANIVKGRGFESMGEIEELLDQGKLPIIRTYVKKVPFIKDFINFDFEVTDSPEDLDKNVHTFIIAAYDREMLYYVELPYILSSSFIPYSKNKSVGVIKKTDLRYAFDVDLYYATMDIMKERLSREIDIRKEIRAISANSFQSSRNEDGGFRIYHSFEAFDVLMEICQKEFLYLNQDHIYYHDRNLKSFFEWKLSNIISRRMLFKEILHKSWDQYPGLAKRNIFQTIDASVEEWRSLVELMIQKYNQADYLFGKNYLKHFHKLKEIEYDLIQKLSEI